MRYADAASFRQALEQRLKRDAAGDGARLSRNRKRIAFDRLLARLAATAPDRWLLKGGYALDLRMRGGARTTKDIDLDWGEVDEELLDTLLDAADLDMGDYFIFRIERRAHPAAVRRPGDQYEAGSSASAVVITAPRGSSCCGSRQRIQARRSVRSRGARTSRAGRVCRTGT